MVDRRLEVLPDAEAAERRAAEVILESAASSPAEFAVALSRGRRSLFAPLAELPWDRTLLWQVDERVAPDGDPERNATDLLAALPRTVHARLRPMPVTDVDLEASAARYADALPPALDVVHLGIGHDGHTASLVPGDPVVEVDDRDVAVTAEHQGHRRMTLTFPTLDRAGLALWLVTGEGKASVLPRLMEGDRAIPAGRVATPRQLVVADAAAAAHLS